MEKIKRGLKTCRRCKTPIHENSLQEYCSRCYKVIEDVFDKIREYLREYPGATAYEMEQRLEIPVHVINNFVKDGRLVEIPNGYLNIQCARCGCLLLSAHHKYCPSCEVDMRRGIQKAKDELSNQVAPTKDSGKMHLNHYLRNK